MAERKPYLGTRNVQRGRTPYLGGPASEPAPHRKKKGSRSLVNRFVDDLRDVAVHTPAGLAHSAETVVSDLRKFQTGQDPTLPGMRGILKDTVVGGAKDLRHPLRHPGLTFLDALALGSLGAGGVARGAAAAGRLSEGASVGEALRAGAGTIKPGPRVFRDPRSGASVSVPASKSALTRGTARQIDSLRERFPDARIGIHDQPTRVGRALERERAFEYTLHTTPFVQLKIAGRKIRWNSPQGRALRAVAEGSPLADVIRVNREALAKTTSKVEAKALRREVRLAEQARQYVNETPAGMTLADPKLQDLFDQTKAAATLEDSRIAENGIMSAEGLAAAVQAPGRVYQGAQYVASTAAREGKASKGLVRQRSEVDRLQGLFDRSLAREPKMPKASEAHTFPDELASTAARSPITQRLGAALSVQKDKLARMEAAAERRVEPTGLIGAEDFDQGQFHVGQVRKMPRFGKESPVVAKGSAVRNPKAPGRLTHSLTGSSIRKGGLRHDVPRLVAENALESEKHAALIRAVDYFKTVAQDTPEGLKRPVPILLDEIKTTPEEVRLVQDAYRAGATLSEGETGSLGFSWETTRNRVFPKAEDVFPQVDLADIAPQKGVKWIDERLLGGLNKPSPLESVTRYSGGRLALTFTDAVNDATKTSLLYLKPAYALPNMLGNAFLTVTQQGWAAPVNLARAVTLSKKMGVQRARLMDNVMGEGLAGSLLGAGSNPFSVAASAGSHVWSKLVDVPFRRAAFIHEARKLGYKTPKQMGDLLADVKYADDLAEAQTRATRAIIDYGDLTPMERSIIRRVLFFYPWLKGSTRYAGEYLREHPVQAAFISHIATDAKERQLDELGPVPPYGEGLFKVGERDGQPMVSNPTSAGILGQPADLAAIAQAFLSGNVPRGQDLSQLLTPALGAGIASATGYEPFSGQEIDPSAKTFGKQLVEGQPLALLFKRLTEDQSQRTFPLNHRDAWLQFLLGTPAPRPVNLPKLNDQAKRAYEPRG